MRAMTTGPVPEFDDIRGELDRMTENLEEVLTNLQSISGPLGDFQTMLEIPSSVEEQAEGVQENLEKVTKVLKVLAKVPALKNLAQSFEKVVNAVAAQFEKIEETAHKLDEKVDTYVTVVDAATTTLEALEVTVTGVLERITLLLADVQEAEALSDRLEDGDGTLTTQILETLDEVAAAVDAANDAYENTRQSIIDLVEDFTELGPVAAAIDTVERGLTAINGFIDDVAGPFRAVASVISPIQWALDAVDFIYNTVVKPVVDPIIEAIGINRLIDSVSNAILSILPDPQPLQDLQEFAEDTAQNIIDQIDARTGISDPIGKLTSETLLAALNEASTEGNDVFFGLGLADTVQAGGGNDITLGSDGNDTLRGGADDDVFIGGGGDDVIQGNLGDDLVFYSGDIRDYSVEVNTNAALVPVGALITHLTGDDGTDAVAGVERFSFGDNGRAIEVTFTQLTNITNLAATSPDGTNFTGTAADDMVFGDPGSNVIIGLGGNDLIEGLGGNDNLLGGDGNDILRPGTGNDSVEGGAGRDLASFIDDPAAIIGTTVGVSIVLDSPSTPVAFTPTERIVEVEDIEGSANNDLLIGSVAVGNGILGGDGNDTLRGLGADDTLQGQAGDDVLIPDAGADEAFGGDGTDLFVGHQDGGNSFDGGPGNDAVWYGSGVQALADSAAGIDLDSVLFTTQLDYLEINGDWAGSATFAGAINVDLRSDEVQLFNNSGTLTGTDTLTSVEVVVGTIGDDTMTGNAGSQTLIGGSGDDTLNGMGGLDNLFGDAGDDSLIVTEGLYLTNFSRSGGTYDGGNGRDTLWMDSYDLIWNVDLTNPAVSFANGFRTQLNVSQNTPFDIFSIRDIEVFRLGSGDDTLTGNASEPITAYGGEGRDSLTGASDADVLMGEAGDDILSLTGSGGSAVGGLGNDQFYSSGANTGGIVQLQGGAGNDIFYLMGTARESVTGGDGTDRIDFSLATGTTGVTFDLDGTASGGPAQGDIYSSIEEVIGSPNNDFISGSSDGEMVSGGAGNDNIAAEDGMDLVYGGLGNDVLDGGADDDILHGGVGNDTLRGQGGIDTASWAFFQQSGDGADSFPRALQMHVIADLQTGVAREYQDDQDSANYASGTASSTDSLTGIENLIGGALSDQLYGDSNDNALAGGLGNDLLEGRAGEDGLTGGGGDDTLRGGADDDVLNGGDGSNILDGGTGLDTLDYSWNTLGVTVEMTGANGTAEVRQSTFSASWADGGTEATRTDPTTGNSYAPDTVYYKDPFNHERYDDGDAVASLPDNLVVRSGGTEVDFRIDVTFVEIPAGTDTITGIERIYGGQAADFMRADTAGMHFNGLAGNDTLRGGTGDDMLEGDVGGDRISGGDGNDTGSGGEGWDRLFLGNGNDLGIGGNGWDIIGGGAGNDSLLGEAGNDTLFGGDGLDTLQGGAGSDIIWSGAGNDLVVGTTWVNGSATVSNADTRNILGGGFGDDSIFAGNGRDIVYGGRGAGNDSVTAFDGNDTVFAGAGDDTLNGGGNGDLLFAGAGNDVVDASWGWDEIWGGAGNDTLTGGAGSDTFGFVAGFGRDEITDFDVTADRLDFSEYAGRSTAQIVSSAANVTGGVELDLGGGDVLFLSGVSAGQIDASLFV